MTVFDYKFFVGDEVVRRENVLKDKSRLMHGVVIYCYSKPKYPTLYDVQWDNGKVGKGYLPHGISYGGFCPSCGNERENAVSPNSNIFRDGTICLKCGRVEHAGLIPSCAKCTKNWKDH